MSPASLYHRVRNAFRRPAVPPGTSTATGPTSAPEPRQHAAPEQGLTAIPTDTIAKLIACPACGHEERTSVCRFNRFALGEWQPDTEAGIYKYSLCHGCGAVYATRRPEGPRYRWLFEHFDDTLGRVDRVGKLAITPSKLTPDMRDLLRTRLSHGVYVSDHQGLKSNEYLGALMRDRLASSPFVEMIGSLIPVQKARVLEIRSKLGSMADALRRLFAADVRVMTLFENQQFIIQEAYGIPAVCGIDYDRFTIPFEGEFDLIIANHMLTHSLRPREFLAEVRKHLAPGGYLYLHTEMDEAEYLVNGKSMFHFNPFHMQAFNRDSLMRVLAANGFTTTFATIYRESHVCVARKAPELTEDWPRMPERERKRRRSAYRQANDRAILTMPEHARWQVKDWDAVLQRGIEEGHAELTKRGVVKLRGTRK